MKLTMRVMKCMSTVVLAALRIASPLACILCLLNPPASVGQDRELSADETLAYIHNLIDTGLLATSDRKSDQGQFWVDHRTGTIWFSFADRGWASCDDHPMVVFRGLHYMEVDPDSVVYEKSLSGETAVWARPRKGEGEIFEIHQRCASRFRESRELLSGGRPDSWTDWGNETKNYGDYLTNGNIDSSKRFARALKHLIVELQQNTHSSDPFAQ